MDKSESRGRGVLTSADRAYLRDPDSYDRQASYERRKYIKERTWNAFLDGSLLTKLPPDRRKEIFNGWQEFADSVGHGPDDRPKHFGDAAESRGEWVERIAAEVGFAGWFEFLYLGLTESEEFDFADVLETAVRRGEFARGRRVAGFSLQIDTRPTLSLDELRDRLDQREYLTTTQLRRLRGAGVEADELAAYLDEAESQSTDPRRMI
jgi:hypothetical protein